MVNSDVAANNLALFKLQTEHDESFSNDDLYARYMELYKEFLESSKKYSRLHSGTKIEEL